MDFDFTPEEEAFRAELRAFLDDELPTWWKTVFVDDERAMPFTREFCHQLAERGWLTLSWPAEHGGADGLVWQ
jgi:alkylation response protein AidB-like acyl-CoA dehydrogenase